MDKKRRTVVIFSGGMDSTILLYHLLAEGHEVFALSVNYGQRHQVELEYAQRITGDLDIPHEIADLSTISSLLGSSSQTDASVAVPLGHYAEENMKTTVVPNRNMIMLSVAVAWAIGQGASNVAYAAHAGDHAIYPDCRTEFAEALGHAIELCDWHKVKLICPFVDKTKADIARLGSELAVPFERTWSCYQGGDRHCGACGTCIERREALMVSGIADPTKYLPTAPMLTISNRGELKIDWTMLINGTPMHEGMRSKAETTK